MENFEAHVEEIGGDEFQLVETLRLLEYQRLPDPLQFALPNQDDVMNPDDIRTKPLNMDQLKMADGTEYRPFGNYSPWARTCDMCFDIETLQKHA